VYEKCNRRCGNIIIVYGLFCSYVGKEKYAAIAIASAWVGEWNTFTHIL